MPTLKKAGASLTYDILYSQETEQYRTLSHLIPCETLIGPSDRVPGLQQCALPPRFNNFDEQIAFVPRKTLFAHNVTLTKMNEVEETFQKFLRALYYQDSIENPGN